jgi:glycosyltransferase involved in cell wall biosynthesis
MKILLSTPHSGAQTGSGIQIALLGRKLAERGHQVHAAFKRKLEHDRFPPTLLRVSEGGVNLLRVPYAKLKHFFVLPTLSELRDFIADQEFDIIHLFAGMDFDFFFLLSFLDPTGALLVNRGTCVPLDIFNSIKYRSRRVSRILAVSEAVRDTMIASGRVPPGKIEVVYSSVDLDLFDPGIDGREARSELGLAMDVPVIGTVGSLHFEPGHLKGGMELLQTARLILREHPRVIFLLVGGIDRSLFDRAAGDLAPHFRLTGFRQDVPRMLAACDLTLSPSIRAEGLTGVIRESLAMKRPVVATDVGGNREVVLHERTGLLVPPRDPEAMAAAALALLRAPELRERLAQAGRTLVEEMFSIQRRVDRIEQIYGQAVAEKSAAKNSRRRRRPGRPLSSYKYLAFGGPEGLLSPDPSPLL